MSLTSGRRRHFECNVKAVPQELLQIDRDCVPIPAVTADGTGFIDKVYPVALLLQIQFSTQRGVGPQHVEGTGDRDGLIIGIHGGIFAAAGLQLGQVG